jgi:hypothetical protein
MSTSACSSTLAAAPHTNAGVTSVKALGLATAHVVVAEELAPLYARFDARLTGLKLTDPIFVKLADAVDAWAKASSEFIADKATTFCAVLDRWKESGYPEIGSKAPASLLGVPQNQAKTATALSTASSPIARTLVDAEKAATARAAALGVKVDFG